MSSRPLGLYGEIVSPIKPKKESHFLLGKPEAQSITLRAFGVHEHSHYDNWHINYHLIIIAQEGRVQADLNCESS